MTTLPPPVPPPQEQTPRPPAPPSPRDPPATAPPPLEYVSAEPARQANAPAAAALACGVLLFIPFVTGVAAIILGRRGMLRAGELGGRGRRAARAAVVLGVINLILSVLLTAASVPALMMARRHAMQNQCMSNLRQLGLAMYMYAQDNRGFVPPNLDALQKYFGGGAAGAAVCTCPEGAAHGVPPASVGAVMKYSYVYVAPPDPRLWRIASPATTPAAFEPLTNHRGRGANVLFWDGHVEWLEGAAARRVAQLQAAQPALPRPVGPQAQAPTTAPAPAAPQEESLLPE